jgi:hypothetical protein
LQEIDTFFSTILSEQILEKSVMQIISWWRDSPAICITKNLCKDTLPCFFGHFQAAHMPVKVDSTVKENLIIFNIILYLLKPQFICDMELQMTGNLMVLNKLLNTTKVLHKHYSTYNMNLKQSQNSLWSCMKQ